MRKGSTVVRALTAGAIVALFVSLAAANVAAQTLPPEVLKAFSLRSIGPTAQGGRFVTSPSPSRSRTPSTRQPDRAALEVGERRPQLGADIRQRALDLDRRHRRRPVEPEYRVGRIR